MSSDKDDIPMPARVGQPMVRCFRCGHPWVVRNLEKLPNVCPNPKCKSYLWNRPRQSEKKQ